MCFFGFLFPTYPCDRRIPDRGNFKSPDEPSSWSRLRHQNYNAFPKTRVLAMAGLDYRSKGQGGGCMVGSVQKYLGRYLLLGAYHI